MTPTDIRKNHRLSIAGWCHGVVLILSVMLVAYISVDTFRGFEFLRNPSFLRFQFVVCMVFLADFFVELWLSPNRKHFFWKNIVFLIIAIPYLNIVDWTGLDVGDDVYYYLRFVPLLRGAYVMVMSVSYLSNTRIVSIFWSYISLMLLALYFGSLMFYWREHPVNPGVRTYGDAVWWCASEMTTLGSNLSPATVAGRFLAVTLSLMGIVMFPLFTVYITSLLRKYVVHPASTSKENT